MDKSEHPFFSVVIPLYNNADTIEATLRSVLAQTFSDFEVIVVNNHSTDGGEKIAESLKSDKIVVLSIPQKGVCFARNAGIHAARGEIVAFLDADDLWHPSHLSDLRKLFDVFGGDPSVGMFATAYRIVMPISKVSMSVVLSGAGDCALIDNYFKYSVPDGFICSDSVSVPKKILEDIGMFNESSNGHGEDLELWAKLSLKYKMAYCPRVSADYIWQRAGQATRSNKVEILYHSTLLDMLYGVLNKGNIKEDIRKFAYQYGRCKCIEILRRAVLTNNADFQKVLNAIHCDFFAPNYIWYFNSRFGIILFKIMAFFNKVYNSYAFNRIFPFAKWNRRVVKKFNKL